MHLPLTYYGNPILRKKAEHVGTITAEIKTLIADMIETMTASNGLGIAAPQVGKSVAIFITSFPHEDEKGNYMQEPPRVFINPKISNPSADTWSHSEGCLSIPKVYGDVARPTSITVTAMDETGKEFTETFTGWPARVIMHENDHINGVLFIDRIDPDSRKKIEPKLREIKKKYNS
jgi:peptide deformylase